MELVLTQGGSTWSLEINFDSASYSMRDGLGEMTIIIHLLAYINTWIVIVAFSSRMHLVLSLSGKNSFWGGSS